MRPDNCTIILQSGRSVTISGCVDVVGDGAQRPAVYLGNLRNALATAQLYTLLTLGQNNVVNGSLTCNSNDTAYIVAKLPAVWKAPTFVPR